MKKENPRTTPVQQLEALLGHMGISTWLTMAADPELLFSTDLE